LAALASACGDDGPASASADATGTTSGDPLDTSGPEESSAGDGSSSDPGGTTMDPGTTSGGGTTSATAASSSEDVTSATSSSSGEDDDSSTDASTTRDDEGSSTGEPVEVCGDGVVDAGEVCDGAVVGDDTCESLGFLAGDLACDPTCDAFDTTACVANGGGDCCLANGEPGCEDDTCTTDVCYADEGCCAVGWDGGCVALAAEICTVCDGTPSPYPCVEQNIGTALGAAVASGSLSSSDDDLVETCAGGGGVDHVLVWRAPFDGTFATDTIGSDFDTALDVRIDCDVAIACDDDSGGGGSSYVAGPLTAGTAIVISVSGSDGATGNWVLNVEAM
jgi:hypothetical protein